MSRKRPSRREREVAKAMNATKTPSGGAAGWLPVDADEDLAFRQLFINAHTGGHVGEFFKDLTRRRRVKAGSAGAKAGAVELPDTLLGAILPVIIEPPQSRKDVLNAMREAIDADILEGKSGPGMPLFKTWYRDQNRRRDTKFAAMLSRSMEGFEEWLNTFPE